MSKIKPECFAKVQIKREKIYKMLLTGAKYGDNIIPIKQIGI